MSYSASLMMLTILAFMTTVIALTMQFSHLLMSLFCLESMMLCTVLFVPLMSCSATIMLPQTSMILLTFAACEASLGLSIMVIMSRSYGSDMVNTLMMNKC